MVTLFVVFFFFLKKFFIAQIEAVLSLIVHDTRFTGEDLRTGGVRSGVQLPLSLVT